MDSAANCARPVCISECCFVTLENRRTFQLFIAMLTLLAGIGLWFGMQKIGSIGIPQRLSFSESIYLLCLIGSLYRDELAGVVPYGQYVADSNAIPTFSLSYSEYINDTIELLFTNGDETNWLVTTYDEVVGEYYDAAPRQILQSSTSTTPCLSLCRQCRLFYILYCSFLK